MRYHDESITRDKLLQIFEQQVVEEKEPKVIGDYMIVPSHPHPFLEVRPVDETKELPKALQGKFTDIITLTKILLDYSKGQKND